MKVLLTGGAGFIGSHIADQLLAAGHQVVVVDDLSSGRRENVPPGATFYKMDINQPSLDRVFAEERPEAVVHQAAQIDVRRSMADPALDARVNVLGTINVATCGARHGMRHILMAGTGGAVYGDSTRIPTPEDEPALPLSVYGASKLAGEHYLRILAAPGSFRWVSLRYSNVFGPRQDPHGEAGVVAIFSERLLRGEEVVIYGDGEQTRDYVYVGDVARANLLALESASSGTFNIGTGRETSVNQLLQHLRSVSGSASSQRNAPARAGEQQRSVIDAGRARRELGWEPETGLRDGLEKTVAYFRERVLA